MKIATKKIAFLLLTLTFVFSLCACSLQSLPENLTQTILASVELPPQYSITYEVTSENGEITNVQRIVDESGNIYFRNGSKELLFIREGKQFSLYMPNDSGVFTVQNDTKYTSAYVDTATTSFDTYANFSRKQFTPGMQSGGEQIIAGRGSQAYSVSIGTAGTGVQYILQVDKETGVCLGWQEEKQVAGHSVQADGETFICTEFLTEQIPELNLLIHEF